MKVRVLVAAASIAASGLFTTACVPEPPPPTTTTTSTTSTSTTTTTTQAPQSTVDQSGTGPVNSGMSAFAAAQIFTAGRSGVLDKVSLHSLSSQTVPVEISIQSVTATGSPTGTPLAPATVIAAPVAMSGLTDIPLTTPVPVTAGVKYALVVDWVGGAGGMWATTGADDPYPGGDVWYYAFDSHWALMGLVNGQVFDFLFQTWVL